MAFDHQADRTDYTYWDRIWADVSAERVAAFAAALEASPDAIIDILRERGCKTVCDAGCGCGAYALKLFKNGFTVSGFDVSGTAVQTARRLLSENGYPSDGFKTADLLSPGFPDRLFDAVIARDVLDHLPIADAMHAVSALFRLARSGGCVVLTVDRTDEEYESEPHKINADGDYCYCGGKWNGMVFHPYTPLEAARLTAAFSDRHVIANDGGFLIVLEKK